MKQSELDFINSLRQSSRYIEQHRGKICVIYLPDTLLSSSLALKQLTQDVSLLHQIGVKIVLVMGASTQINQALSAQHITSQYHQSIRITTTKMLPIFQQTIGQLRSQLEALFTQANNQYTNPTALISGNWVIAQPKGVVEGIDFQHTGKLRKINHHAISTSLNGGQIVLLTPLAYSLTGEVFNLNTLEQACEVARTLQADKLMIFSSEQQLHNLPKQLNLTELTQTLKTLSDNSHFLTQIAKTAHTVKRVHLINQNDPSALLQELFTRDGHGTLIFSDRYHQLRPAYIEDVGGLLELITPLENQGILAKRSRERLELEIHNFMVIERDQTIIGCAALYPIDHQMGELACLAVSPAYQGQSLGAELLQAIENAAIEQGLNRLCLLTTHTHHWFIEHGFQLKTLSDLPKSRQSLYNLQRQSKVLIKLLTAHKATTKP